MELLQAAVCDDSVTSIARRIGYRHSSSVSQDFKALYGLAPSVVLRASQGPLC